MCCTDSCPTQRRPPTRPDTRTGLTENDFKCRQNLMKNTQCLLTGRVNHPESLALAALLGPQRGILVHCPRQRALTNANVLHEADLCHGCLGDWSTSTSMRADSHKKPKYGCNATGHSGLASSSATLLRRAPAVLARMPVLISRELGAYEEAQERKRDREADVPLGQVQLPPKKKTPKRRMPVRLEGMAGLGGKNHATPEQYEAGILAHKQHAANLRQPMQTLDSNTAH